MKRDSLTVLIGQGLGLIRLGMCPNEVMERFPEEQGYEEWMGGNLNDSLLFHGLIFQFDRCNSKSPLPKSKLNRIVIHQRVDVVLFERPMTAWTRGELEKELSLRGYNSEEGAGGDLIVPEGMECSFDEEDRFVWAEIMKPEPETSANPESS